MAFATTSDIAVRLEIVSLSSTQAAAAALLIPIAQAIITEEAGQPVDWAPSPVPTILKGLTIELVCRAMASPQGLQRAREAVGAFEREEVYREDSSTALLLTPAERAVIRRFGGGTSGSVRVPALVHDIYVTEP